jgi:hypothetical protein
MRPGIAFLLLLWSVNADALTLRVDGAAEVSARLRRLDADEPVRQVSIRAAQPTEVDVSAGSWEITIDSDTLWAAPVYAMAAESVTLAAYPRAEIAGSVRGGPAPGELSLRFSSETLSGSSPCEITERTFRCAIPVGTFDVRLFRPGFATEFRWGVTAPTDLKEIDFTPGSSLSGYVEGARGSAAEVVVQQQVKTFKTKPNARGFFQVKGLAPGEYTVRATAKDLASETRTVQVIGHTNATLKEPLVLAKPASITVTTMPQLDPHNQPWRVALWRNRKGERWLDSVTSSNASPNGEWSARGITPGDYVVTIQQQDGSQWKSEPVAIGAEDVVIPMLVTGERVTGKITLGDRPIAATLHFGGEEGQAILAAEDGTFSGVIAPLDDAPAVIDITAEDANVRRTVKLKGTVGSDGVQRFDIHLAATVMSGTVRKADGSPASGAIVSLNAADGGEFTQTFAREDGTFDFAGFEPGVYDVGAQAFLERSDLVEVKLTDTPHEDLVLVLKPETTIRGRVVMGTVPVTNATVYGISRNVPMQFGGRGSSDLAGKFTLRLPPGTETYDIAVIPRGFYVSIGRMRVAADKIVRAEIAQDGGSLTVDAPAGQYVRLLREGAEFSLEMLARESEGTVEKNGERQKLGIGNLEPGMYSVCGAKECVAAYVARWGAAVVSLR